jgi:hypothetical protein
MWPSATRKEETWLNKTKEQREREIEHELDLDDHYDPTPLSSDERSQKSKQRVDDFDERPINPKPRANDFDEMPIKAKPTFAQKDDIYERPKQPVKN